MLKNSTISAWSYSRLATWRQCPFKAKLTMIDKLKEPTNDAMMRGANIHKKLEVYMKERGGRAPKEAGPYKDMLRTLKKDRHKYRKYATEMQVAFDREGRQVDWFARTVWLRGIFDLFILKSDTEALIIDYKTGKKRDEHVDQADMYAALFYLLYKDVAAQLGAKDVLTVQFLYVDQDDTSATLNKTYSLEACELHWKRFEKMGDAMTSAVAFVAKQGPLCKWCHFRKDNGGPCEY